MNRFGKKAQRDLLTKVEGMLQTGMYQKPAWYDIMKTVGVDNHSIGRKPPRLNHVDENLYHKLIRNKKYLKVEVLSPFIADRPSFGFRFVQKQLNYIKKQKLSEQEAFEKCEQDFSSEFKEFEDALGTVRRVPEIAEDLVEEVITVRETELHQFRVQNKGDWSTKYQPQEIPESHMSPQPWPKQADGTPILNTPRSAVRMDFSDPYVRWRFNLLRTMRWKNPDAPLRIPKKLDSADYKIPGVTEPIEIPAFSLKDLFGSKQALSLAQELHQWRKRMSKPARELYSTGFPNMEATHTDRLYPDMPTKSEFMSDEARFKARD